MKSIKNIKPSDIPLHILKENYPEHAKLKLAHIALTEKDYDSLRALFDAMQDPYVILDKAMETLNVEAFEVIINKSKDNEEKTEKLTQYLNNNDDDDDDDSFHDFTGEMNSFEQRENISKIIKLIVEFLNKEDITLELLKEFILYHTREEFEDLVKLKEIDLTQDKFNELDTSPYELDPFKAILFEKHSISDYILHKNPPGGILDLLLSRTYSDELNLEEISTIYRNLYNLSPISKEIITYTAALISKDNSIKIRFDKDIGTDYNSSQNLISINTDYMKDPISNIESIIIHEMGHYIYEQLFKTDSRPFSFDKLTDFINQHKAIENDPYMEDSFIYKIFYNQAKTEEIKEILDEVHQYEKAARKPIEMAAKLLKMDVKELDEYIDSNDLTEFFKDNSYIDIFHLNDSIAHESDIYSYYESIDINIMSNIYKIYYSENNICSPNNPLLPEEPIYILKWVTEYFLPRIVEELKLSPTQIHFLERIADYVNRGKHLLDEKGREDGDYERHIELTVRATELRASGVEEELVESFKELEQIHIKTSSPRICDFIHNSDVASISFDGEDGSLYTCLEI